MSKKKLGEEKTANDLAKIVAVIVILGIILASIVLINNYRKFSSNRLKLELYNKFTCSCCEGTIAESTCLTAGGMRDYMDNLISEGYNKNETIIEATKRFGVNSIADEGIAKMVYKQFNQSLPKNRAIIQLSRYEADLGMVSGKNLTFVIADFKITNNGTEDLIINDIKTSCACLTASILIDGDESPRQGQFSNPSGWSVAIKPGKEAILRAVYNTKVNLWSRGYEKRFVYIYSNDPINWGETITIEIFRLY